MYAESGRTLEQTTRGGGLFPDPIKFAHYKNNTSNLALTGEVRRRPSMNQVG